MKKLFKKVIGKKEIIALMTLVLMITITGCKNIGTTDGKTGTPMTEVDNSDTIISDGGESDSKNEDLASIIYDKDDIIMKAEKETYPNKVEGITISIENKTSYDYYYGEVFSLELLVDGEWVLVSPKEEIFVIEIANVLESNGQNTFTSPLIHYGELSDGHYRIVKNLIKSVDDQAEKLLLAAEFSISSEVVESPRLAAVYVSLDKETYSNTDNVIKFTIGNNTDETKSVVLAPLIEKEVGDGWEAVKCEVGYCGVADSLEDKIEGEIGLEWFPSMDDGVYRVSFNIEEGDNETTLISDIFTFSKNQ